MKEENLTLAEAAVQFLASLPPEQREETRQEVNRFVRWFGKDLAIQQLSAHDVANYAERMEGSPNAAKMLEPIKAFLSYAKKKGFTLTNLGVNLKLKKTATKHTSHRKKAERVALTAQGYQELKAELSALEAERGKIAEEIHKAAADKDFRENAPLDAIKDHQGQVEARIRELAEILKSNVVTAKEVATAKVEIGCTVVLRDLLYNEELRYTLVHPSEADPAKGTLSVASPLGKALLGKEKGAEVEVTAPMGKLHYRIEGIES